MTYELIEQLKDAGLAMTECGVCGITKQTPDEHNEICSNEGYEHVPTLSELIEACGTVFYTLLSVNPPHNTKWFACNYGNSIKGEGDTPEIAVAELWLKLQK